MEKKYFKVGDLVTCSMNGKGKVITINENGYVRVSFEEKGYAMYYNFEGRFLDYTKRTLHQGHIDIPEPELKEIVTFEKGELVWAMDYWKRWYCVKFQEIDPYFPHIIRCYNPQSDPKNDMRDYYDIKKYEDRPF